MTDAGVQPSVEAGRGSEPAAESVTGPDPEPESESGSEPEPESEPESEHGASESATELEAHAELTSEPAPEIPPPPTPSFRVMHVEDVSLELPSQYPTVSLIEAEPPMRSLVFPVGLPEGAAMAQALRRLGSRRPMTHELFMDVLQRAHIDVICVRLIGREEGNLLAEIDLMTPTGGETLDCRPSDGLVLALRMPVPAPILVDERLLDTLADVAPFDAR